MLKHLGNFNQASNNSLVVPVKLLGKPVKPVVVLQDGQGEIRLVTNMLSGVKLGKIPGQQKSMHGFPECIAGITLKFYCPTNFALKAGCNDAFIYQVFLTGI